MARTPKKPRTVETLTHGAASRRNIPTAEFEPVLGPADQEPVRTAWARRNRDLDPQLVWCGKDLADWSDLVAPAPPLFIQEKVHPKVLVDDLRRETRARQAGAGGGDGQPDLFADFNGLPVGHPAQRHVAPVPAPRVRPHRREGDQPPGRRGDEGVPGVKENTQDGNF